MDNTDDNNLYVDMHIHTNCSDGVFTPKEAVEYAYKIKLAAISITDHDSVDGIEEALKAASKIGLEVIPGIELSSEVISDSKKSEIHILGYCINYKSEELKSVLSVFKKARRQRAITILEKLKQNGIELKDKSFLENAGNKAIGRLHFAKALVAENIVESVQQAFQRYLAQNKPVYVPKYSIPVCEIIKLILKAGGVPVIAHPYYIHDNNIFESLVKNGLMGIEAWHIKHPESAVKRFLSLAEEFGIIATGGSDCHGPYKKEPPIMGTVKVPYSVVINLKNKAMLMPKYCKNLELEQKNLK